jgi:DNA-3-methyladenine glycosylase II
MNTRNETVGHFVIEPEGPFSLEPARKMMCGFLRGTRSCSAQADSVKLAFPLDGSFRVVGVELKWDGERINGSSIGTSDVEAVKHQVARVLAVDSDATPFDRLIQADPALRQVASSCPGYRPVVSYSPYVMAGWSVLSQRLRMSQAAAIQIRIAEAVGDVVEIDGEIVASFPRPESLLRLSGFPGVSTEKWTRLRAVAEAAQRGELEPRRLLALPNEEARKQLMTIRGVGPWTADGVLIRGCGSRDMLPLREPTLHGAVGLTYRLDHVPTDDEVRKIAESWRPFRTWVSVMLIAHHFDSARRLVAKSSRPRRPGRRSTVPAGATDPA